ncbi:MAG: efflux RND transporter periplasmic adaptor subunit [Nitrospiraceae bacterium]|nr:efflux RND transporter periplasmic adaptor subunit [Nitrospiraceae bacterium]
MIKRMIIMLVAVGLVFGGLFAYHAYEAMMQRKSMAGRLPPPVAVSAMRARYLSWQPEVKAVGSLRAVRGVDVTSEIAGLVSRVYFKSGQDAWKNRVLVQLNADSDIALLHSLEAAAQLARTVYERDKKQFAVQAVSRATLDADAADLKGKTAQVRQQRAIVEKKTIRAPFAGRLGISTVNPGQYINPGDKIVTLQALDRLYADFYLPQQQLSKLRPGQEVLADTDAYPGLTFRGRITSINPQVDPSTRNAEIEAEFANPGRRLLPGMYAVIDVRAGAVRRYLTLPQTAITYNPYGETVFVVAEEGKGPDGRPILVARQVFVTTGGTRGDQVAIVSGITEGQLVVTSGQLKLKNGSRVAINNQIQPSDNPAPRPPES